MTFFGTTVLDSSHALLRLSAYSAYSAYPLYCVLGLPHPEHGHRTTRPVGCHQATPFDSAQELV